MYITPETVTAFKNILLNPSEHGCSFRPITDCFEKSEAVTANHMLFNEMKERETPRLPKFFFYVIMEELYGPPNGKDKNGDLGYHLTFKPAQ
jgi:hypothetical protein